MPTVLPGSTVPIWAQFPTGLAGTLGVRVRTSAGANFLARTTAGIVEDIAGSGMYRYSLTAPTTAGNYEIIWDALGTWGSEELVVTWTSSEAAPSGTALASTSELGARLGIDLTDAEESRAAILLSQASDLVRTAAKQHISLVTDDTLILRGQWGSRLKLPERPVSSVASVYSTFRDEDPVEITSDTYYLDNGGDLVKGGSIGVDERSFSLSGGWLGPAYSLTVTYTHGYSTIPVLAKAITVESVARVWVNPEGATQSNIAGVLMAYPSTGLLLTPQEFLQLRTAFAKRATTVNLR